jgi:hypothetical protein
LSLYQYHQFDRKIDAFLHNLRQTWRLRYQMKIPPEVYEKQILILYFCKMEISFF